MLDEMRANVKIEIDEPCHLITRPMDGSSFR